MKIPRLAYFLYIHCKGGRHADPGVQERQRTRHEQVLGLLIRRIPVLPFDEAASVKYGLLRAPVPYRRCDVFDRLIAAHAVSVGAILVTNNAADFKDYPGLVVESWVSAPAP